MCCRTVRDGSAESMYVSGRVCQPAVANTTMLSHSTGLLTLVDKAGWQQAPKNLEMPVNPEDWKRWEPWVCLVLEQEQHQLRVVGELGQDSVRPTGGLQLGVITCGETAQHFSS